MMVAGKFDAAAEMGFVLEAQDLAGGEYSLDHLIEADGLKTAHSGDLARLCPTSASSIDRGEAAARHALRGDAEVVYDPETGSLYSLDKRRLGACLDCIKERGAD